MLSIFFEALIIPTLLVLFTALLLTPLPAKVRLYIFAFVFSLILTPSWGPATIVAVPLPFGFLLGVSISGGFISELPLLVILFWWWHLIMFPLFYWIGLKVGNVFYALLAKLGVAHW